MRHPALLLLSLIALSACSDPGQGASVMLLGWTFADGRRCADSGVEQVAVLSLPNENAPLWVTTCARGYGAATVPLPLPAGELELRVDGLSATGSALYRRTRRLTLAPGEAVTWTPELVFTGGF